MYNVGRGLAPAAAQSMFRNTVMDKHDLDFIYEQLKNKYDLILTNTFALDSGYTIDVKVLCGESIFGKFNLYKEDDDCDEFVFTVECAAPRKPRWYLAAEKYTHWHPQSREQALNDVIAFMEGTHRFLL